MEWHDHETGARGWLVLNSLRGGAAGGGTRMRRGVTREEVTYLAKAMQLKFAFSGPPIGGGKCGIDFDPSDPRREEVLRRWYRAIWPFLATRYGTGGDVNVDEQHDVVPLCRELGLLHPQEGVVRGHLEASDSEAAASMTSLAQGISQPAGVEFGVSGVDLSVSDLITGYGVYRACRRLYEQMGATLDGVGVIVEGFGNVGAAAALYLAREGARIVGIADRDSGLAAPQGLDASAVEDLLRRREARQLPPHPLRKVGPERELAYRSSADLFVPAAISGSVDARRLAQLARHGVRRIVCGANQPFHEVRLGDTHTTQAVDAQFQVLPDIVSSMGMARTFHHLMMNTEEQSAADIFRVVGDSMDEAVDEVLEARASMRHSAPVAAGSERRGLIAAALGIALERTGS